MRALAFAALAAVAGCAGIGPARVTRDRFDYVAAISESWKQQMLLNLLKVRYSDAPVFLEVSSIIASYTVGASASVKGEYAPPGRGDTMGGIGFGANIEERPTITFSPLAGEKFARSLMTPLPVSGILYLLQAGFPAENVLRAATVSVNGFENAYGGRENARAGDPRFAELLGALRAAQRAEGGWRPAAACNTVVLEKPMKMQQVSENCFAVLNEKNLVCDANSGFINLGGGVVVDTQSDLPHARQMIGLFGKVWKSMPTQVINTHEDGDHVWGNQLFEGAEIIAHRTVRELMPHVADPKETQDLISKANHAVTRLVMKGLHPGALAIADQLHQDYDFEGIQLVLPTTVFEDRYVLNLDGTEVHLIYVGPCHQTGDTLVHVPSEGVVFTGDVIFHECTPMGWNGSYDKWMKNLDFIISLNPKAVVPGHGPVCGVEGVKQMKAYLQYVRDEAKRFFGMGLSSMDASKKIDFGPYAEWRAPARIYMNIERAYREFRNEAGDAPWDHAKTFDHIHEVAKARGLHLEF